MKDEVLKDEVRKMEWKFTVDTTQTQGETGVPLCYKSFCPPGIYLGEVEDIPPVVVDWGDGEVTRFDTQDIRYGKDAVFTHRYDDGKKRHQITMSSDKSMAYFTCDRYCSRESWEETLVSVDSPLPRCIVFDDDDLEVADGYGEEIPDDYNKLHHMFANCKNLEKIPEDLLVNNPDVTDVHDIFYNCAALKEIPAKLFHGNPKIEIFDGALCGCNSLKEIYENLFVNSKIARSFRSVFSACPKLEEIPPKLFANCVCARDFSHAFADCNSIKKLPAGLFANCKLANAFDYTFCGCRSLTKIPQKFFAKNLHAKAFFATFHNCGNLSKVSAKLFAHNGDTFIKKAFDKDTLQKFYENSSEM